MLLPESLRRLARDFDKAHKRWHKLRHTLIEAGPRVRPENIGLASIIAQGVGAHGLVRHVCDLPFPFTRGEVQHAHRFYVHPKVQGDCSQALSTFRRLARRAVTLLVDAGKRLAEEIAGKRPAKEIPCPPFRIPLEEDWTEAKRLMVFVHQLAWEDRPGSLLRAKRGTALDGHELPEGVFASDLLCRLFDGAALALTMVADDCDEAGGPTAFVTFKQPRAKLGEHKEGGDAKARLGASPTSGNSKPRRHRGGRPGDTDPKEDRRIVEAWKTGMHAYLEDLAQSLGKAKREVKLALDRHRKRGGKTSSRKSCQGD